MIRVRFSLAVIGCLMATSAVAGLECTNSTLKIATLAPERHSWVQDLRKGAKEIKEQTDGRINLKLYVGGVMGDDEQVLRRIKTRQLHGAAFTPMGLQEVYADANIYGLPFMFENEDEVDYVRKFIDHKLFRGLKENGFVTLGWSNGGFAYLMSNGPVQSLDDLYGKKVWVPEKDFISYATMEALELSPVVLPMTDVLPGLERGLLVRRIHIARRLRLDRWRVFGGGPARCRCGSSSPRGSGR